MGIYEKDVTISGETRARKIMDILEKYGASEEDKYEIIREFAEAYYKICECNASAKVLEEIARKTSNLSDEVLCDMYTERITKEMESLGKRSPQKKKARTYPSQEEPVSEETAIIANSSVDSTSIDITQEASKEENEFKAEKLAEDRKEPPICDDNENIEKRTAALNPNLFTVEETEDTSEPNEAKEPEVKRNPEKAENNSRREETLTLDDLMDGFKMRSEFLEEPEAGKNVENQYLNVKTRNEEAGGEQTSLEDKYLSEPEEREKTRQVSLRCEENGEQKKSTPKKKNGFLDLSGLWS